jgi:hypothetical protein
MGCGVWVQGFINIQAAGLDVWDVGLGCRGSLTFEEEQVSSESLIFRGSGFGFVPSKCHFTFEE